MSDFSALVEQWHRPVDHILWRILLMGVAFYHVALLMWNPQVYAETIGGFNFVIVVLLIWAICSSMIFGIGFKPRRWFWQIIFTPYLSGCVLVYFSLIRII
ncbi:cyd operon protein YbgE [Vibrio mangrovi]|uniref:Cyd operon protein YbgE n=1 Tax=Vibrio mangrovi TaxID=474394 RepID=A0A1Y6IPA5_9VIBR|nr:cyd operon protein YbgE [Vibrio mangrovi]MDW6003722.1 cyd operon protein YbgE [Vibrio mangrovi]SMR99486.1 hypothetical protein VIM7927_00712 [Vibrio mangrovi]